MYFAIWALIVGALLITMALSGTWLRRLPVSTAMLYLAPGFGDHLPLCTVVNRPAGDGRLVYGSRQRDRK
jgi:hypothetical protein